MNRIKQLRKEKGYTQMKMQMLTGIDQSDYSKLESGKRNLTFEQCKRIALVLGTSMDYLAGITSQKKPYPPDEAEETEVGGEMYRRIRDLREDKDLSQQTLAELLHVSQATYSRYESGVLDIPSASLIALAEFYGTSVDYILGVSDNRGF